MGDDPKWLKVCEFPDSVERRFYSGPRLKHAESCLAAGYEDNAASWMWLDVAEYDEKFAPVFGTLQAARRHGTDGILYVDARDVAAEKVCVDGDGI